MEPGSPPVSVLSWLTSWLPGWLRAGLPWLPDFGSSLACWLAANQLDSPSELAGWRTAWLAAIVSLSLAQRSLA